MAINSQDSLVTANVAALLRNFQKASVTAKAAGTYQSLWTAAGMPGAGSAPSSTAGVVPTSSTAGAIPFTNSNVSYLQRLAAQGPTVGTLILYDRLVHSDGLSGTVGTAQTVGTPSLTRATDGIGVEIYLEWYTATGGTAATVTASYTNTTPASGRTTVSQTIQATPVAGQMQFLPLQAGDLGVTAVASVTLSGTTGTAGNFGITLVKRIAEVPITLANVGNVYDQIVGPVVEDSSCLALMVLCSTTSTGLQSGSLRIAQG